MLREVSSFNSKIVGVTYSNTGNNSENRQCIIRDLYRKGQLRRGQELKLVPEPTNPHDQNAIAVIGPDGRQLGHLPKELARSLSPQIRAGKTFRAFVELVTGGDIDRNYGVNLKITSYIQNDDTSSSTKIPDSAFIQQDPPPIWDIQKLHIDAICGDLAAQHNLGGCYMEGVGVERDPYKGAYWFSKAAEQGDLSALCNLGMMYINGLGVPEDPETGFALFLESANGGFADAQNNLGCCYMYGVGVQPNNMEAYKWFQRAANSNHPGALYNLGLLYIQGEGIQKDLKLGLNYITRSAQNGYQDAIDFLHSYFEVKSVPHTAVKSQPTYRNRERNTSDFCVDEQEYIRRSSNYGAPDWWDSDGESWQDYLEHTD